MRTDAGPTSQQVHWKRWDASRQLAAAALDAVRRVGRGHEVQSDKSTVVTVLCDEAQAVVVTTTQLKHYKLRWTPCISPHGRCGCVEYEHVGQSRERTKAGTWRQCIHKTEWQTSKQPTSALTKRFISALAGADWHHTISSQLETVYSSNQGIKVIHHDKH